MKAATLGPGRPLTGGRCALTARAVSSTDSEVYGKRNPVTQLVIPESHVPVVLSLLHDTATAGHKGKEHTISVACMTYYWPTMRVDIDEYANQCVQCVQQKGSVPKPAPILEYPPPERPWDVVAMDVLHLSVRSRQGSKYVLVMVDHFSRYVALASFQDKSATRW